MADPTTIAVYEADETGVALTYSAVTADDGNWFPNTERTCFLIPNGSVSPVTVTITARNASTPIEGYGTVLLPAVVVTVPAGEEHAIMAPPGRANDSSGYCTVVCATATADVKICAIKLTRV